MSIVKRTSLSLYDDDEEEETVAEPVSKKSKQDSPPLLTPPSDSNESSTQSSSKDTSSSVLPSPKRVILSVLGARKGERAEMEDTHVSISCLPSHQVPIISRISLYAIFDGHAGARASRYCEDNLPKTMSKLIAQHRTVDSLEKGMKKLFIDTYKNVDDAFLKEARVNKPAWKDGTTATTLLVLDDTVYTANIGDSKGIVCRKKDGKDCIIQLTVDHNPVNFEERQRISKAGGVVKNGRIDGIIEVSRSIGDGHFKTRGVTCIPDIKKFSLTPDDKFILIACDGLWKSFSNEEAVEFVWKLLKDSETKEEVMEGGEKSQWEWVASEMAAEAVRRRCGDNVSVLILVLR